MVDFGLESTVCEDIERGGFSVRRAIQIDERLLVNYDVLYLAKTTPSGEYRILNCYRFECPEES